MTISINPNRITLDEAYMQMAEIWAKRSKANRLQVGSILVKDTCIISDGYNGMPSGSSDEVCEYEVDIPESPTSNIKTKPQVLHAESNVFMKLAKFGGMGSKGATLYVTHAPCVDCAKLCLQAGIARLVYRNAYRDTFGIDLLLEYNIVVDHLKGNTDHEPDEAPHHCQSC